MNILNLITFDELGNIQNSFMLLSYFHSQETLHNKKNEHSFILGWNK